MDSEGTREGTQNRESVLVLKDWDKGERSRSSGEQKTGLVEGGMGGPLEPGFDFKEKMGEGKSEGKGAGLRQGGGNGREHISSAGGKRGWGTGMQRGQCWEEKGT